MAAGTSKAEFRIGAKSVYPYGHCHNEEQGDEENPHSWLSLWCRDRAGGIVSQPGKFTFWLNERANVGRNTTAAMASDC